MGRGTCSQSGICDCDPMLGWRGDVCQIPGCPGITVDCTGHGDCNSATHECTCNPGWAGLGCEIPDCPGAPNCNNRGYCNASADPPQCQNCSRGWMGPTCADPCTFGEQVPMDSGQCKCWPGYSGKKNRDFLDIYIFFNYLDRSKIILTTFQYSLEVLVASNQMREIDQALLLHNKDQVYFSAWVSMSLNSHLYTCVVNIMTPSLCFLFWIILSRCWLR